MKYAGMLILLASTLISAQDTAKFYFIAKDGPSLVMLDGVTTKVGTNHYLEQQVFPGRHNIGYQMGYFGDWTAMSLKVTAGQTYYFVFSFAPGIGGMCSQLSAAQGPLCLRALEERGGTEACHTSGVDNLYPFFNGPPANLLPWGFRTR